MRCPQCGSLLASDGVDIPGCPACGYTFHDMVAEDSEDGAKERAKELYTIGFALDSIGQRERAIELFTQALSLDPKNPEIWAAMGFACQMLGQFEKAIVAYSQFRRQLWATVANRSPRGPFSNSVSARSAASPESAW